MKKDEEWARWASDFQRDAGPTVNPSEVIAAVRRGTWKQVAQTGVQVAAHVFAIVAYAVLSVKVKFLWPFAALVIPAFSASLGIMLWTRFGTWRADGETVGAFVDLEWRRKRGELVFLRVSEVLIGVLAMGFAIWLPYFLAHGQGRPDLGMPFLAARLVFAVAVFVGTWFYLRYQIRQAKLKLDRVAQVRASVVGAAEG